jgi:hypothetical protein
MDCRRGKDSNAIANVAMPRNDQSWLALLEQASLEFEANKQQHTRDIQGQDNVCNVVIVLSQAVYKMMWQQDHHET